MARDTLTLATTLTAVPAANAINARILRCEFVSSLAVRLGTVGSAASSFPISCAGKVTTRSACLPPACIDVGVTRDQFMPMFAAVVSKRSPSHVLLVSNLFKVCWVYAKLVAAQMIDLVTVQNVSAVRHRENDAVSRTRSFTSAGAKCWVS